jgi:GNAT superfamily N-acetyltransferase
VTDSNQVPHQLGIAIRRATAADAEVCGKICFEAFGSLSARHGFPNDFPSPEIPAGVLAWMFAHPGFFCVVAEQDGKVIGSNCLDERTPIAGVGPITIDPGVQNQTAGRQLMQAVMTRAADRGFAGVRLVQAAWHSRSLALYTKLGFIVREPLVCMQGPPIGKTPPGYTVRPAKPDDLATCNDLCLRVHGHQRGGELSDAIEQGQAVVAEFNGRLRAYSSGVGFFGHTVGEGNDDLIALLADAGQFAGPGILVPSRNSALFRWCLEHGLRVVQSMTLMSVGLYNEPAGAFLPSVIF